MSSNFEIRRMLNSDMLTVLTTKEGYNYNDKVSPETQDKYIKKLGLESLKIPTTYERSVVDFSEALSLNMTVGLKINSNTEYYEMKKMIFSDETFKNEKNETISLYSALQNKGKEIKAKIEAETPAKPADKTTLEKIQKFVVDAADVVIDKKDRILGKNKSSKSEDKTKVNKVDDKNKDNGGAVNKQAKPEAPKTEQPKQAKPEAKDVKEKAANDTLKSVGLTDDEIKEVKTKPAEKKAEEKKETKPAEKKAEEVEVMSFDEFKARYLESNKDITEDDLEIAYYEFLSEYQQTEIVEGSKTEEKPDFKKLWSEYFHIDLVENPTKKDMLKYLDRKRELYTEAFSLYDESTMPSDLCKEANNINVIFGSPKGEFVTFKNNDEIMKHIAKLIGSINKKMTNKQILNAIVRINNFEQLFISRF